MVGLFGALGGKMEYKAQPDKRLVALVLIAVCIMPAIIAAELAFPGLQPKFQVSSPSGGSSSPSGGGSTSIAGVKIIIPNGVNLNHALNFQPSTITLVIGVNNTVTWINQDTTDHTATFSSVPSGVQAASVSAGDIPPGTSFGPITFTVAGTYLYHCQFHPGWMRGTIIVKAA
jgi:plastocyanin